MLEKGEPNIYAPDQVLCSKFSFFSSLCHLTNSLILFNNTAVFHLTNRSIFGTQSSICPLTNSSNLGTMSSIFHRTNSRVLASRAPLSPDKQQHSRHYSTRFFVTLQSGTFLGNSSSFCHLVDWSFSFPWQTTAFEPIKALQSGSIGSLACPTLL